MTLAVMSYDEHILQLRCVIWEQQTTINLLQYKLNFILSFLGIYDDLMPHSTTVKAPFDLRDAAKANESAAPIDNLTLLRMRVVCLHGQMLSKRKEITNYQLSADY